MSYTNSATRHDFVILFDVTEGNPNGNPDADNMPRYDEQTRHGLVSDVALKRKVRNYVQLYGGQELFIQSATALNTLITQARREAGANDPQTILDDADVVEWLTRNLPDEDFEIEGATLTYSGDERDKKALGELLMERLDDSDEAKALRPKLRTTGNRIGEAAKNVKMTPAQRNKLADDARTVLCRTYYDVRMFGAVIGTGANAGTNAGQVRGPMQVTFARSIDPIFPQNHLTTRNARTTSARMKTGSTEFGRKVNVPYGLYRAHGFYTAVFGQQTGVSDDDLKLFWEAITHLFDLDKAAARPEMAVQGVYIFTHENPRGNAAAHKLFERIQIQRKASEELPRAFTDYDVTVNGAELPTGVTLTHLDDDGLTLTRLVG